MNRLLIRFTTIKKYKKFYKLYEFNGFNKILEYIFIIWKKNIDVLIYDNNIRIRKKSPDLNTALKTLGPEFDILQDFFDKTYDGLIVDAGGYIGTAAINFSRRFPQAKIVTIEPNLQNFNLLEYNTSKYKNIIRHRRALAISENSEVPIFDRGHGPLGYSIIENNSLKVIDFVKTISLNEIIAENRRNGILKIDIEGFEYYLLTEAKNNLNSFDVIIIELHERIKVGIETSFKLFNNEFKRLCIKTSGEKYISIKRQFICN